MSFHLHLHYDRRARDAGDCQKEERHARHVLEHWRDTQELDQGEPDIQQPEVALCTKEGDGGGCAGFGQGALLRESRAAKRAVRGTGKEGGMTGKKAGWRGKWTCRCGRG
ncbi:hypothetical protein NUW54_g12616 [Trametes sanguinea]|uniref:Uncharacterized protein n=1 Tax=Trametes sanguinea TaxID=158606 RepID=A0ACC1MW30_9APHY|nr:hypothetical protein NUW54_g12616 [Trametes sanguinea]